MATHSSILAWRIPRTEEPGRLWSTGCRVRHDWSDWAQRTARHSTRSPRNRICIEKMINPSLLYQCLLTLELVFSVSHYIFLGYQFSSVQLLVSDSAAPWAAPHQASLSIINSRSLFKLMSIELVMPSNHLILCHPLLLPSIFPSMGVFSNESVLHIRWPKYWSFSFSFNPSNEYSVLISLTSLISSQSKGLSRVFSNTIVQKHQFLVIIVLNSAKKCYGYNDHFGWIPKSCLYMH